MPSAAWGQCPLQYNCRILQVPRYRGQRVALHKQCCSPRWEGITIATLGILGCSGMPCKLKERSGTIWVALHDGRKLRLWFTQSQRKNCQKVGSSNFTVISLSDHSQLEVHFPSSLYRAPVVEAGGVEYRPVMVNLGCQSDCIWNQPRDTPLCSAMSKVPGRVNWGEKINPRLGGTF